VYIRIDPDSYKDLIDPNQKKNFPFRPGMNASADIQTKTHKDVLSIPINAVSTRDKSDSAKKADLALANKNLNSSDLMLGSGDSDLDEVVFVVDADGTVRKRIVKTSIQDINNIEVVSGLKEGDQVITGPYEVVSKTLKDGDKVKVVAKESLFSGKK
jgi:HlyD family secretion protein